MRFCTRHGRGLRALFVALVATGAFAAAGCEVEARVTIAVDEDGSGEVRAYVTLDAQAVAAVAGDGAVEDAVRLDDLVAAGWTLDWEHGDDGSATVRLAKPFGAPDDLPDVIAELSGPTGPLRDVALERDDGPLATDFALTGTADLTSVDLGVADDAELAAALTAERVDVAALEAALAGSLATALHAEVAVALPGGGIRVVAVEPGTSVDLATSSTQWDLAAMVLALAAVGFAVLAVLIVVIGWRTRQNRRRGRSVPTS